MTKSIAKQLLSDAKQGHISKDDLLEVCLKRLASISEQDLYDLALDEGFINVDHEIEEIEEEKEFRELSASQRIIEKVLSRYGD